MSASTSLVESPHFRWCVGMLDVDGDRLVGVDGPLVDGASEYHWANRAWLLLDAGGQWLPDLADPATQGCFAFELLPNAWGPDLHIEVYLRGAVTVAKADGELVWSIDTSTPGGDAATELGEALAAALLAASPKTEVESFEEIISDARSRHTPEGRARLGVDDDGQPLQLPPEDRARLLAKYGNGAAPPKGGE